MAPAQAHLGSSSRGRLRPRSSGSRARIHPARRGNMRRCTRALQTQALRPWGTQTTPSTGAQGMPHLTTPSSRTTTEAPKLQSPLSSPKPKVSKRPRQTTEVLYQAMQKPSAAEHPAFCSERWQRVTTANQTVVIIKLLPLETSTLLRQRLQPARNRSKIG